VSELSNKSAKLEEEFNSEENPIEDLTQIKDKFNVLENIKIVPLSSKIFIYTIVFVLFF
jgi:hypothetical protein